MIRSRSACPSSLVVLLSCSLFACKQSEQQAAPEAVPQTAEASAVVNEVTPEPPEPTTVPTDPQPVPTPVVEPIPVSQPAVAVEAGTVPIAAVKPTKVSAAWRELASPSEPLTFVYLAGGVLARSPSGYYDRAEDGTLVLRREIEFPSRPEAPTLLGYWPKDVWDLHIRQNDLLVDPRGDEYFTESVQVSRLRDNHRWVVQEHEGEEKFQYVEIRKGWKGGLLVREWDRFTRLAGGAEDPQPGLYEGSEISSFVETHAGELYTISQTDDVLYVQRDCQDQACVDANAKPLPFGPNWSFALQVPRQRHSVSLTADYGGDVKKFYLLHYEKGGWKLEAMPVGASGLWPSEDGGLWAMVGSELWHRDPDGAWRNITLPERASSISAAMLEDQSELWIAALVGSKPVVFATHANAQEPPPTEPGITTQTG